MDNPIKIESGIPLPRGNGKNGLTKVMSQMKIGDSFLYEKRNSIHQLARYIPGSKFVTRAEGDCFRIWRVA